MDLHLVMLVPEEIVLLQAAVIRSARLILAHKEVSIIEDAKKRFYIN